MIISFKFILKLFMSEKEKLEKSEKKKKNTYKKQQDIWKIKKERKRI